METVLSETIARLVRAVGPEPDETLVEMQEYARQHGFPTVGPEAGGALRLVARMVDAERIFEFGSGYGYSAYWFAEALPDDGRIVLTEYDADELEMAREYLERGGYGDLAVYERGDALDVVDRYDGPFDVVLVDHQKHRYREAFDAVKETVPPGGVVVADNAITSSITDVDALLALLEDDEPGDVNEQTRGVANYLDAVRSTPGFETVVLPVGEGLAVSYRHS